jgi:hypothetical protein
VTGVGPGAGVRTRALLIDPVSLRVVWTNDDSVEAGPQVDGPARSAGLDEALPMAATMGVPEALRRVASTGVAEHLRAEVIATRKGGASLVVSIYRLPGGEALLLVEDTWRARGRSEADLESLGDASGTRGSAGRRGPRGARRDSR